MTKPITISPQIIGKISKLSMCRAKSGKRFSVTDFVNNSEIRFKIIQEVVGDGDHEALTLAIELMSVFFDLSETSEKQAYYDIGIIEKPKSIPQTPQEKYFHGARS